MFDSDFRETRPACSRQITQNSNLQATHLGRFDIEASENISRPCQHETRQAAISRNPRTKSDHTHSRHKLERNGNPPIATRAKRRNRYIKPKLRFLVILTPRGPTDRHLESRHAAESDKAAVLYARSCHTRKTLNVRQKLTGADEISRNGDFF